MLAGAIQPVCATDSRYIQGFGRRASTDVCPTFAGVRRLLDGPAFSVGTAEVFLVSVMEANTVACVSAGSFRVLGF